MSEISSVVTSSKLNPFAPEFVPFIPVSAPSKTAKKAAAKTQQPPRQEPPRPAVIKDKESDEEFLRRLRESRKFWDLEDKPAYQVGFDILKQNRSKYERFSTEFSTKYSPLLIGVDLWTVSSI